MQTLSGSLLGLSDSTLVVVDDAGNIKDTMTIKGRYYYVKKCTKPEESCGISIPHKSRMDHPIFIVLAVGTECGKPAQLDEKSRKLGISTGQSFRLKPMTKVLAPDDSTPWMVKESPYSEGETLERLWHEDIIKCIIEDE